MLGATTAGGALYYYVIDEYRVSNELLTEDIYVCLTLPLTIAVCHVILYPSTLIAHKSQALQSAVQRIEGYVKTLETKVNPK